MEISFRTTFIVFVIVCLISGEFVNCARKNSLKRRRWKFTDGDIRVDIKKLYKPGPVVVSVSRDPEDKWPDATVYYRYNDDGYSANQIKLITDCMKTIEDETCVRFRNLEDEDNIPDSYVVIYSDRGTCDSEVGRTGGAQRLNLDSVECMDRGVVLHELFHVLGFVHEQNRNDRDDYVTINFQNIDRRARKNFNKYSKEDIRTLNFPYDVESIMHYRADEFAKEEGLVTVMAIDEKVSSDMLGSARTNGTLSELDVQKLNIFYDCKV